MKSGEITSKEAKRENVFKFYELNILKLTLDFLEFRMKSIKRLVFLFVKVKLTTDVLKMKMTGNNKVIGIFISDLKITQIFLNCS